MMPMVSPDFMSRFISDRTGVSAVSEYLKVTCLKLMLPSGTS